MHPQYAALLITGVVAVAIMTSSIKCTAAAVAAEAEELLPPVRSTCSCLLMYKESVAPLLRELLPMPMP
jgi:hypothetical protein